MAAGALLLLTDSRSSGVFDGAGVELSLKNSSVILADSIVVDHDDDDEPHSSQCSSSEYGSNGGVAEERDRDGLFLAQCKGG